MAEVGYSGRPLIDKLGVKEGARVAVVGVEDAHFERQLRARTADVAEGRLRRDSDVIVYGATATADLGRLAALKGALRPAGAIWVVWPKGRPALTENHVRAAALASGLVDVKVCAFSATHSALKLVIPVAERNQAGRRKR